MDIFDAAIDDSLKRIKVGLDVFVKKFPHVSEKNIYAGEENKLWTASFYPGMCYLAYELTGDKIFIEHSDKILDSFEERLLNGHMVTHDIGFLFSLTCVANYKLTDNRRAKELALAAAEKLAARYNEKGKYIQAWGEMDCPNAKIIIDTMLNLPLLFWTGNERFKEIAYNHAVTAAKYLIREDASSYHTYVMNPQTGEAVCGKTHQGNRDESTWARGQAWAVYGFALSYAYTGYKYFLDTAERCAKYYMEHLPTDLVPYWDFDFDGKNPDIRDTSAASILACGLLEISKYSLAEDCELYRKTAQNIVASLYKDYFTDDDSNGLLKEGMYHRNDGANECVIWGDYYFMEALVRLKKDWKPYW